MAAGDRTREKLAIPTSGMRKRRQASNIFGSLRFQKIVSSTAPSIKKARYSTFIRPKPKAQRKLKNFLNPSPSLLHLPLLVKNKTAKRREKKSRRGVEVGQS